VPHPTQPESAFNVPFEAASASLARERVGRMLAGVGIDGRSREDVMVVVSELVGNAVRHARPLPEGGLRVRTRVDEGRVSVAVDDGGAISLPTLRVARVTSAGGRGLAIIDRISDGWGSERSPDGTQTVWALVHY